MSQKILEVKNLKTGKIFQCGEKAWETMKNRPQDYALWNPNGRSVSETMQEAKAEPVALNDLATESANKKAKA